MKNVKDIVWVDIFVIYDNVEDNTWYNVSDNVYQTVGTNIRDNVRDNIRDNVEFIIPTKIQITKALELL